MYRGEIRALASTEPGTEYEPNMMKTYILLHFIHFEEIIELANGCGCSS
jgi:hypothetical protein